MSGISTANSSAAICVPSPVFREFAMPSGVCKYSLVFCLCNSLVSSDTGRPVAAHDAEQCRPLLRCLTPHLGQFFSLYCPLILSLPLLRKPLIYYFPPLYPTLYASGVSMIFVILDLLILYFCCSADLVAPHL